MLKRETFAAVIVKLLLLNAGGRQPKHQHVPKVNASVLQAG